MSTPLATNREPAYQTTAGVLSPFRFSARGDGDDLDRAALEFHIGAGPVFWQGGHLPEEDTKATFLLRTLTGVLPRNPATRTIMPNQSLKLEKLLASQDQEALYLCGGLESPADPQSPLMVQFTLALAQADVTPDPSGFTGVLVGLKNGNTGVAVKFYTVGGVRRIEMQFAQYSTSTPPSPAYVATYDWDQSRPHTYKLLWHPRLNVVRLYVSSGQDSDTPDTVLIDGATGAFPGPLPSLEIPHDQPLAYFGHGYPVPTSTSYWGEFYFHNKVSSPIVNGLFQGGHNGVIQTDEAVWYRPTELPRNQEQPWPLLPTSFDDMAGGEEVTSQNELWLTRAEETKSFGFYRKETELKYWPSVLDFEISGELLKRPPSIGEATGMEVYVDDGTRHMRFALLDSSGTQSVGLLFGSSPEQALSYLGDQVNWVNATPYRLILDPTGVTPSRLIRMSQAEEGVEEEVVAQRLYSQLPVSAFPGPSVGFLHNANTIAALARMKLGRVRYSTGLRYYEPGSVANVPWSLNDPAKGSVVTVSGEDEIRHTVDDSPFFLYHNDPKLVSSRGFFVEFRGKVSTYSADGLVDPIRRNSGVGVSVDDGTYQYMLMFADMGPPTGKIVFLATQNDLLQNLYDIRSGKLLETFAVVDWSKRHIYRLEKSVGGVRYDGVTPSYASKISLYVDDSDKPAVSLTSDNFTPIPTAGVSRVKFGSMLYGRTTTSVWKYFRYGVSSGFDVSALPVLTSAELTGRFNNALNTIAEVWTS